MKSRDNLDSKRAKDRNADDTGAADKHRLMLLRSILPIAKYKLICNFLEQKIESVIIRRTRIIRLPILRFDKKDLPERNFKSTTPNYAP